MKRPSLLCTLGGALLLACSTPRARTSAAAPPPAPSAARAAPTPAAPAPPAPPSGPAMVDAPRLPAADAPTEGPASALVTVLSFVDYQCTFCQRVEPILHSLREQYGEQLRVVYRMYPLGSHPEAMLAAEAAMAASAQGRFLPFHSALYANPGDLERPGLERVAQGLGMDMARFRHELDEHVWRARVRSDHSIGLHGGMQGTPAFFINGTLLSGGRPREEFVALIERAWARARLYRDRTRSYALMVEDPLPLRPEGEGTGRVLRVAPAARNPTRGAASAPVTLEHFADLQCPYCAEQAPVLDQLLQRYEGRLRVVWRDLPLPAHPDAFLAAEAAREAFAQQGNDGFWRYHDALLQNQRALGRPELERYAQAQGLDLARFRRALDAHSHRAEVQADVDALNATGLPDPGTPTSFLEGRYLDGSYTYEELRPMVDQLLAARGLPVGERAQRSARLSQVLVGWRGTRDATPQVTRTRAEARARIDEALARLRAGDTFAAVAGRYSDDPGADRTGGLLGQVRQGDNLEAWDTAAFALAPGATSEVFETELGFHLVHREP